MAMIDNPNKNSILDWYLNKKDKFPKLKTGNKYTTKHMTYAQPKGMPPRIYQELGKIPPAAKRIPSGSLVKPGILTALLGGYGIGTLLDEQFDLSGKIAEALIQDPDMSGAKDMPGRPGGYEGDWRESYSKPEDYYEGETEATIEDLQKILQPMMQTPEKVRWK
jgi:hypothetical protein